MRSKAAEAVDRHQESERPLSARAIKRKNSAKGGGTGARSIASSRAPTSFLRHLDLCSQRPRLHIAVVQRFTIRGRHDERTRIRRADLVDELFDVALRRAVDHDAI